MKVLVDTDLILVACLNLGNWEKEVELLWDMIESRKIEAYITECGLAQIIYVVTKVVNTEIAEEIFIDIEDIIKILPIDESLYKQARQLNLLDFNSALEIVAALANNLDAVVTLTPNSFISSNIKVVSIIDLFRESLDSSFQVSDHKSETRNNPELENTTILSYPPNQTTNLTQWLQNRFDSDWHSIEKFLIVSSFAFRSFDSSIKRCKLIDFLIKIETITVVLIISIELKSDKKIGITIQVHPINSLKYLPKGLQMTILDKFENSLEKIISRELDNYIQCQLVGEYGESFSIKLSLGSSTFIENFII